MVAYSYKSRFVNPIRMGLGLSPIEPVELPGFNCAGEVVMPDDLRPKLQTIRADRKRHARPGEELQHYCGMRTKNCFLIGRSRCIDTVPILMRFAKHRRPHDLVRLPDRGIVNYGDLCKFAMSDGFRNWEHLKAFWRQEHPGITDFEGILIRWEPLP